ncbi:MAG: SIS domain-containing protein, partial [Proteobacteria bacterium]|nr:SIS domain-containing protein [Pseudomonadota bacterium]
DMGFDLVFSRYLEAHGRPGDILLAISTSGTSANVLRAAETAKRLGMVIVALTGKPQCKLGDFADVHIATPAGSWADRVQELHIKVIHSLIDMIESGLFSKS